MGRPPDQACRSGYGAISSGGTCWKEGFVLDYTDRLLRLAINDSDLTDEPPAGADVDVAWLDPVTDARTLSLVRLAALVAVGGAVPSYAAQADAAVDAGATAAEIVDVLFGVIPVVGLPCAVAAAPNVAMALGHDINDALEDPSGGVRSAMRRAARWPSPAPRRRLREETPSFR